MWGRLLESFGPTLFGWVVAVIAWWWSGKLDAPLWARFMFTVAAYLYAHDDLARSMRRPR